jgi:glucosamine-phosphate N-acetyltransferase
MNSYFFRKLTKNDYVSYFNLIQQFRPTSYSKEQFDKFLSSLQQTDIIVMIHQNKIIASGTILYETKLIHNISLYAHIEDIIVDNQFRKQGIGKLLIEYLVQCCKNKNCYKILLDCQKELIPFYEKNKFQENGVQMVIYKLI